VAAPVWRSIWDGALFLGGLVPALVYGVAFGNVLQGVPFRFDDTLRLSYEGSFWALFNPFALLCGLVSVTMLTMHGAAYLACKTRGAPRDRARQAGTIAAIALLVLFILGGVWASQIDFYTITQFPGMDGPSNPLLKQVARAPGGLMANYGTHPWMILAPLLGILGALASLRLTRAARRPVVAFVASGLSIAGVIATAGCSLFPFLLPSSLELNSGLTVWDASSSRLTLAIMTLVTVVFLPIVLAYTAWVYHVLREPVTAEQITADEHNAY
jgi:cytochrome d ubiquinol oxidase subunit II